MSAYLESHREEYYSRLQAISNRNDFQGWVRFFLQGMVEQAEEDITKVKAIMSLYEEMKHTVTDVIHSSQNAIRTLDTIFSRPILSSIQFTNSVEASRSTSFRILGALVDASILELVRNGSGQRPSIYVFPRLLDIVNN